MPQAETFYFISSAQYFYYHVLMAKAFVDGGNSLAQICNDFSCHSAFLFMCQFFMRENNHSAVSDNPCPVSVTNVP